MACALVLTGCGPPVAIPQGVQVYFSPRGGATEAVVNALDLATNTVLVQAGLASGAATHEFITKRMEQMGTCHETLKQLVGVQEAARMMVETLEALE